MNADHLDSAWHRELLEQLCAYDRETASPGEREAAAWLVERLVEEGAADALIEEEQGHHTFWWPLGLACGAAALAGLAGARRRSLAAAALASAAAWAAADELPPRGRRLRRVLPQSSATNVLAVMGPPDAPRTVVIGAHHDAAHTGRIFDPTVSQAIDRRAPWFFESIDTSPPLMWPAVLGPGLAALGAATGRRRMAGLGALTSAAFAAAMADIARSPTVAGANDNGTAVVALIALARALAAEPTRNVRVLLISTYEEALCEGMRAFAERHFAELPRESTFFLTLEALGSEHLLVLRGEGMLGVREYPERSLQLLDGLAEEEGLWLFPNLRLRNATDGVYPLAAGYEGAALCSCNHIKQPNNYHWPTDVPENVNFATLRDGIRLAESLVRRLDERWLQAPGVLEQPHAAGQQGERSAEPADAVPAPGAPRRR